MKLNTCIVVRLQIQFLSVCSTVWILDRPDSCADDRQFIIESLHVLPKFSLSPTYFLLNQALLLLNRALLGSVLYMLNQGLVKGGYVLSH